MEVITRKNNLRWVSVVISLIISCCFNIYGAQAKAADNSLVKSMDAISFIGFVRQTSSDKGKCIFAQYFIPDTVDMTDKKFGVIIFPKRYLEMFDVYDNYIEEFASQNKVILNVTNNNYYAFDGGRMLRFGIVNIFEKNCDLTFCFIPYLKSESEVVYGTRQFATHNEMTDGEVQFIGFTKYSSESDGECITALNLISEIPAEDNILKVFAISEAEMRENKISESELGEINEKSEYLLETIKSNATAGSLYRATLRQVEVGSDYYFATFMYNDEDGYRFCYYNKTNYHSIVTNNIAATQFNGVDPKLGTSVGESLETAITRLKKLVDSIWVYIVIGFAAVVIVWGSVIGVKVIVAKRREEKVNSRGMLMRLAVGTIIMAVIAVSAPLVINGLSAWTA